MKMNRRQLLGGAIGATAAVPLGAYELTKKKEKVLIHEGNMPNFDGMVYPRVLNGTNKFVVVAVTFRAAAGDYCSALVEAVSADQQTTLRFETAIAKRFPEFRVGQCIGINVLKLMCQDYSEMPPIKSLDIAFVGGGRVTRSA